MCDIHMDFKGFFIKFLSSFHNILKVRIGVWAQMFVLPGKH